MNQRHLKRYEDLELQADLVLQTKRAKSGGFISGEFVDQSKLDEWRIKTKSLISISCGKDSEHYSEFEKAEGGTSLETNLSLFKRLKSVFNAAREDYEGGYLISVRALVQAEVFDSELEQAKELLESGYLIPSAVVAGIVLETCLRELCDRCDIPHSKLDKMNSDLAKAGLYNKLQQKRITALADIRNSAAHGRPEEFNRNDVQDMINEVERFLASYLINSLPRSAW